jgi:hypothetical protein
MLLVSIAFLSQPAVVLPQEAEIRGGAADTKGETPNVGDAEREQAKFLLAGVWNAIEELRSGIVKVHRISSHGKSGGREEYDYLYAFDLAKDCIRFDYHGPDRMTQYVRNESETLQHLPSAPGFGIASRHPKDYKVVFDAQPFDFRWIGMTLYSTLQNKSRPERARKFLDGARLIELSDDGTQVRLTWNCDINPEKLGESMLLLDRKQGLRPVLWEERYREIGPGKSGEWYVECRTETTWAEKAQTWVPMTCTLAVVRLKAVSELTLNWVSVNDNIPHRMFEMEGLNVEDETVVLNAKLGEPISEGRRGESKIAKEFLEQNHASAPQTRWWLLVVNLVVLLMIATVAAARRCLRRK